MCARPRPTSPTTTIGPPTLSRGRSLSDRAKGNDGAVSREAGGPGRASIHHFLTAPGAYPFCSNRARASSVAPAGTCTSRTNPRASLVILNVKNAQQRCSASTRVASSTSRTCLSNTARNDPSAARVHDSARVIMLRQAPRRGATASGWRVHAMGGSPPPVDAHGTSVASISGKSNRGHRARDLTDRAVAHPNQGKPSTCLLVTVDPVLGPRRQRARLVMSHT